MLSILMAQALIRKLNDDTLDDYRANAKAKGSSLEADLRDLIERNRPRPRKSGVELLALSERLCAMTIGGISADSTPYIRWTRDTNHGKLTGETWEDHQTKQQRADH
jgi:antitoxin FitA